MEKTHVFVCLDFPWFDQKLLFKTNIFKGLRFEDDLFLIHKILYCRIAD